VLNLCHILCARRSPINLSFIVATGDCGVPRATGEGFRIDVDLDHARREAERVRDMLRALRRRHDLSRFEYTRIVRIVPGGDTFSHPMLTLGNRFAENEDTLLSTYLHEQMHWYLWYLGTPERDPVAPFFDELVRRYPEAPTELPDGARNYESTYLHLVINWLEVAATAEFVGRHRAVAVAEVQRSYRWIYRTVLRDWDALQELYERHGLVPIRSAQDLMAENAKAAKRALNGGDRRNSAAARRRAPPQSRRRLPARGGRSAG
jgi:hypothetical protein